MSLRAGWRWVRRGACVAPVVASGALWLCAKASAATLTAPEPDAPFFRFEPISWTGLAIFGYVLISLAIGLLVLSNDWRRMEGDLDADDLTG